MTKRPIWEDVIITLNNVPEEGTGYSILADEQIIYQGKAYAMPNRSDAEITINDICAGYLDSSRPYPYGDRMFVKNYTLPTFRVEREDGTTLWQGVFTLDWLYDGEKELQLAAAPINGVASETQSILHSVYESEQVDIVLNYKDGTKHTIIVPISRTEDFNSDFGRDFARSEMPPASGTVVLRLSQYPNVASVEIGDERYTVERARRYMLTYRNAFGGWDTFLVQAAHTASETIKRYEYTRKNSSWDYGNRGRTNYLNECQRAWNFTTPPLNDAQSARMYHLLGSNEVYLTDLNSDQTFAVLINATSVQYRNIRSEGNTMPTYSFTVEMANKQTRR